jgi:succinate dehydrogenase hydrophobic anchor subunit
VITVLLIVLVVLLLVSALPTGYGYSHPWGYYPSGILGVLLVVLLVLALLHAI